MPLIFKIFLLLFLQQGQSTLKKIAGQQGSACTVDWERVVLSKDMKLNILAEPEITERVINVCLVHDIGCEVIRESSNGVASVEFKNLTFIKRNKIMEQLQMLESKAQLQWND